MVEWFRNFESDLTSMNVENYMNAKTGFKLLIDCKFKHLRHFFENQSKKMEKSLNSLIQKHRFEAPVLVTIQVIAQNTQ